MAGAMEGDNLLNTDIGSLGGFFFSGGGEGWGSFDLISAASYAFEFFFSSESLTGQPHIHTYMKLLGQKGPQPEITHQ